MRLRNIAIVFLVVLMSFAVARMLVTVSRAEEMGSETARANTAKVMSVDVANAPKRDGEVEHIILATSTHFESLVLLLLGSILLTVASGIKVVQSRRVR